MSDITETELRKSINEILEGADLNKTSSRKIRKQLEEKFDTDLTKRKKEIDDIIMNIITENKQSASEEESGEEEESEEEYESESEEDVPKKKPKMSESKKSKKKKGGDSSSESDWEESNKKSKKDGKKGKKENSYTKKLTLSADLAELVGAKEMARPDVVKKMWEIVRERNLFDPSNKQFVICDAQLKKIFGEDRIRMFGVMKYLKAHMSEQK